MPYSASLPYTVYTEDFIDLRSDTVTRPCPSMRDAMMTANVGDDVFKGDPTVIELEEKLASMLGKEAGLFVSSGTQSNLCAMLSHCGRGDEYISGEKYHIFCDEAGGAAVLGGISPQALPVQPDGSLDPDDIVRAIKPDDIHCPRTRALFLENTVHGMVVPMQKLQACVDTARQANLVTHLDGARFFNAIIEMNIDPEMMANPFDTVSICLSKGLGAPVGSVLVGSKKMIKEALRWRKMLGGGTRQAGILAAAGLYALEHNITRLKEDHRRATQLAEALDQLPFISVDMERVNTNMVFFSLNAKKDKITDFADSLRNFLKSKKILALISDQRTRLVLHKDIDDQRLNHIIDAFKAFD